jgi:hypothetical protein
MLHPAKVSVLEDLERIVREHHHGPDVGDHGHSLKENAVGRIDQPNADFNRIRLEPSRNESLGPTRWRGIRGHSILSPRVLIDFLHFGCDQESGRGTTWLWTSKILFGN